MAGQSHNMRAQGWPRLTSAPNQLYCKPLTESHQYGWLVPKNEAPEAWTQIKRFPRKNSEMTKFVKDMSLADPEFSLF
ncbi:hypothetical protein N1851_031120 [Merluccius polli]|uniref:Uncharacterized protein n=1 Tax=Merluccius polli TaxID=89951 RepID=A0AA47NPE0_MERPO|nr:hypothetical protein N1851_031120 [Merluccius polli]